MQNNLITELLIAEREKCKTRLEEINALLGGPYVPKVKASIGSQIPSDTGKKKRTMSPEARAKIAAAQKARWAKQKKAK